jgi:hypothetical protein
MWCSLIAGRRRVLFLGKQPSSIDSTNRISRGSLAFLLLWIKRGGTSEFQRKVTWKNDNKDINYFAGQFGKIFIPSLSNNMKAAPPTLVVMGGITLMLCTA